MMRQMRENTKWIMLVTALAFVALMVFEWGMDVSGRSSGGIGEIGRVNGEPVFYEDYIATYRNLYDQLQQAQDEPITSQQDRDLESQAFDEVVNQILIRQELDRRGIRVTDDEVRQAARFSPPPGFANNPAFQTDGFFDLQKYQNFLALQADDMILLQLEAYYRDVIPRSKLLRQVTSGLYLSDAMLWQQFQDRNETVEVRYVPLNPGLRIPDDSIQVTAAEIERYYRDHQEDFEQPARASVQVAVLGKAPSPGDTALVWARAAELLSELTEGADFAEMARLESGDQSTASEGGLLGVLGPNQTVPVFDSLVFSAPVGRAAGPIQTQGGLHLLRVDERWGQDSAQVRHILLPMVRGDSSEIALLTLADSLEDLALDRTLADAAAEVGIEAVTVELTEAFPVVPGAGQVGEGADWAFGEAEPGEVSPLFENGQAFYAMELLSRTPGGVLPLERAENTIRQILTFEKKLERARTEAQALAERARSGAGLPNVAADAGLEVRGAGPFSRNDFVPGLGRLNAAIGAAFGLRERGRISDAVTTDDNVFVIELMGRTPADSTEWETQKDLQRQQLQGVLQEQHLQNWLEGLRSAARIVDRRVEVLRAAEEPPVNPMGGFGF
jgi:peptidyl-prolyl cis-trans isomerase D